MHLRLPLVCGVVAIAALAAGVRTFHQPPPPALDLGTAPTRGGGVRPHPKAVASPARIVVYVAGAVAHPGLYHLAPQARAADALAAAGGPSGGADLVAVNLAAVLADGDEVAVYERGSAPSSRARRAAGKPAHAVRKHATKGKRPRHHAARGGVADAAVAVSPVDLNHAGASELASLPGVGPALAERIVIVRETSGRFTSLDDLLDVGGMTLARIDALAPLVTLR